MSRNKQAALNAVVAAAERTTAADVVFGGGTAHSAVGRQDVEAAVRAARTAGATDDEIRAAVKGNAFRR